MSRSTGSITYSLALASASRDDVITTCGSPCGRSWCQDSVLCARYSFIVWTRNTFYGTCICPMRCIPYT